MTREEFLPQFARLCEGHRFDPTGKQSEAYFEELQFGGVEDFRRAVTRLLAAPKFPANVGMIIGEMTRAADERKRVEALKARQEKNQGPLEAEGDAVSEAMEEIYRAACSNRVRGGVGLPDAKRFAWYVERLDILLNDPMMAEWMSKVPMGVCSRHAGDHSTWHCVKDEREFWALRLGGLNEVMAYRALVPISQAPIREELTLLMDMYGRRPKADQTGRLL